MKPHTHSLSVIFLLFILFTGAVIGITVLKSPQDIRSRATATGSALTLAPATATATVGNTVSVSLMINTGSDTISAADIQLTYDPTTVQILSFSPGTILPVILTPESHVNGAIAVTLGVEPAHPYKGTGILCTWTIKLLTVKQSSLNFTNTTQIAAIGKTTNALVWSTGSTITGDKIVITTKPTQKISIEMTSTPTEKPSTPTNVPIATKRPTTIQQTQITPVPSFKNAKNQQREQTPISKEKPALEASKPVIFDQIIDTIAGFFQKLFQPREE